LNPCYRRERAVS